MSKQKVAVPPAPREQIVIAQEDLSRMEEWTEFFRKLSPRVTLLKASEPAFKPLLAKAEADLRKAKTIESDYVLNGWPDEESMAFVIVVDSEPHFFCFGDVAFTPSHFQWDGDAEADIDANSFSLGSYNPDLLSWKFITKLIVKKVRELENRVPKMRE